MVGRGYTVMAMLETKTELSQLGKISTRTGEYRVLFDNYTMGPIYFKTADCLMRGLTADEIKWGLINKGNSRLIQHTYMMRKIRFIVR